MESLRGATPKVHRCLIEVAVDLPQFWQDGKENARHAESDVRYNERHPAVAVHAQSREKQHERNTRNDLGVDEREVRYVFDDALRHFVFHRVNANSRHRTEYRCKNARDKRDDKRIAERLYNKLVGEEFLIPFE